MIVEIIDIIISLLSFNLYVILSDWGIILVLIGMGFMFGSIRIIIVSVWYAITIFENLRKENIKNSLNLTNKEIKNETIDIFKNMTNQLKKEGFSYNDMLVTKKGIIITIFVFSLIVTGTIFQLSFLNPHPPTIIFNF